MIRKRGRKTNHGPTYSDLTPAEMSHAAREALRSYTPARIGLERTGVSVATRPLLDFQLAHAQARDAVHAAIDVRMLCDELRRYGLPAVALKSQARDRTTLPEAAGSGPGVERANRRRCSRRGNTMLSL